MDDYKDTDAKLKAEVGTDTAIEEQIEIVLF